MSNAFKLDQGSNSQLMKWHTVAFTDKATSLTLIQHTGTRLYYQHNNTIFC